MDVVVVESPTKAKTIEKYVGRRYAVYASNGHVRDLPEKDGSVSPDDGFAMQWQVVARSQKNLSAIVKAVKRADRLYLATDPDREGEAISWHVNAVLAEQAALNGVDVKRVVFHEVTENAVNEALSHPRELDQGLVDAYLARRALDYLVGFTLSPVLWRKLPGARSAGRVQSVALRLICEREAEIEIFRPREYWSIEAEFLTARKAPVTARLTHLGGVKLDRYGIPDEAAAKSALAEIERHAYGVAAIEKKRVRRNPQPPFTTSTLQQEASRKLGFSASRTMRIAQRLYEGIDLGGETVGLITYMRTDSINLAGEARQAMRRLIETDYGPSYVPERPHRFRSRARNAQEAHEAIRPTDSGRRPSSVAGALGRDEHRLYELIWTRALASQMASAALEQVAVDIASTDRAVVFRATGQVVLFDGFLKLYEEGRDDAAENGNERILPPMEEGEDLERGKCVPEQHFTKPPPRFTEASLVRRLEELGIGRPSTYAKILSVLQERDYVRLESRRFVPEDRGRIVTAFLSGFFNRYVEYNFTADLEDRLDGIARGELEWRAVLEEFWRGFSAAVGETRELTISDVIDALDRDLGPHFFPAEGEDAADPRRCPSCAGGRLGLKLGRGGGFIGCSNYPECGFTRPLTVNPEDGEGLAGPRALGDDPETGEAVTLRKGPYGFYVQAGEAKGKQKPKRSSLLKSMSPETVTLEQALALLALPREVGLHPATGKAIAAGLGRYGPYLRHDGRYTSLGPDEDLLSIGLNRAVTLIDEASSKARAKALRTLGDHPADGKPVEILSGRFGPYVKHGRTNASLPKGEEVDAVTMETALALLAARAAKGGGGSRSKAGRGRKKTGPAEA
ncbi:MAG: type I DNA topoisomerase [Defluviicoccus sp.]|nr:type I DNA topoisomerase [Defluviicoccus sp.]